MSPITPKTGPKAVTRPSAPSRVASMNPDNFVAGGLMDDFNGTIIKVRFVPWDYNGNIDHHVLGVAVTIQPDEDEGEEFVQTYSCGDLEAFAPSMDGENPVDLENGEGEALEGIYAIRVGKKEQLANSTNWATFVGALIDAGFDKSLMGAEVTFAEGTHGHFNRIPQKKRSGIVRVAAEGEKAKSNDVLVLTEITPAPAAKGKAAAPKAAAPKAAGKPPAKAPAPVAEEAAEDVASEFDELDLALIPIVTAGAKAAGDDGISKQKLTGLAMKSLPANLKMKGVKRIADPAFLEAAGEVGTWAFDAESGIVLYAGE